MVLSTVAQKIVSDNFLKLYINVKYHVMQSARTITLDYTFLDFLPLVGWGYNSHSKFLLKDTHFGIKKSKITKILTLIAVAIEQQN